MSVWCPGKAGSSRSRNPRAPNGDELPVAQRRERHLPRQPGSVELLEEPEPRVAVLRALCPGEQLEPLLTAVEGGGLPGRAREAAA